jgi:preprotein translocase subunit SecE
MPAAGPIRESGPRGERAKLLLAAILPIAGLVGYYYYDRLATGVRLGILAASFVVAIGFLAWSQAGKMFWSFVLEARTELRKVIWPTRKETTDTTLFVLVMVIVLAILLWLIDMGLDFGIRLVTGHAG